MHGYFAHPEGAFGPNGKTSPNSSLADALNWWRGIASARIAGQPLGVTEYGHVYWNRYRYEEGLSVGAYGSFQNMSILAAHAWPVALKPSQAGPFRVGLDPVARASQVVAGLAFMGGAVATAPHRVDIPVSRDLALRNSERGNSGESYEDDSGVVLRKVGAPPVLMRTGRFTIDLSRAPSAPALRAWSLAMNGQRRDELPVASVPGGIRLKIDTAAWSCGPSPFIELAEK